MKKQKRHVLAKGIAKSNSSSSELAHDDGADHLMVDDLARCLNGLDFDTLNATTSAFESSLELLQTDRKKTALVDRERAQSTILHRLASKYDPNTISTTLFETLTMNANTFRSEVDLLLSLQCICAATSLLSEDLACYDKCHEILMSFVPKMRERINDGNLSVRARAIMVSGYAVLSYFLIVEGGRYGVEDIVSGLIDIAESTTSANEVVACAALDGAALLLTLTRNIESLIDEYSACAIAFMGTPSIKLLQSVSQLVGVLYERLSNVEAVDRESLLATIDTVMHDPASSKQFKTAKKDKKTERFSLRALEETVRTGKSPRAFGISKTMKQKLLPIQSWSMLIIVRHLRWVFGPAFSNQIAINPFVTSLVLSERANPGTEVLAQTSFADLHHTTDSSPTARRTVNLRRARMEKAQNLGLI